MEHWFWSITVESNVGKIEMLFGLVLAWMLFTYGVTECVHFKSIIPTC